MKKILITLLVSIAASSAFATDVGVSVTLGDPGFYGRIDLGNIQRPQVIYTNPIVINRPLYGYVDEQPLYLRVPPGHARHWREHCEYYDACGRPVYFVQENWYNQVYVPQVRGYRSEWNGDHGNHGRGRDDNHGRRDRDDDQGENHGHGRGHNNED
ncbi:hypothetical protein LPB67_17185 [Undibacterium sp. Jales W-56]|uniref:hypothetical protein n=1 Tax=Undibacterium sp. Jales W-56 TaxID=2897325 RepID=UPI0021D3C1FE|nr:hypothetical protein [Undibacterium sp. Jales W-56]MCU6435514.1 hypothetical protein [Undibacterium sp. Jales W-56]